MLAFHVFGSVSGLSVEPKWLLGHISGPQDHFPIGLELRILVFEGFASSWRDLARIPLGRDGKISASLARMPLDVA